jgi:hypothetical protein
VDDIDSDDLYYPGLFGAAHFFRLKNRMSNRRFQSALDLAAYGGQAELRVGRPILNVIVVSIIIAIAIIPARLADWIA